MIHIPSLMTDNQLILKNVKLLGISFDSNLEIIYPFYVQKQAINLTR